MRRSSRILSAAALTGVLSLVAAPALANGSGQTVVSPPWSWYISSLSAKRSNRLSYIPVRPDTTVLHPVTPAQSSGRSISCW